MVGLGGRWWAQVVVVRLGDWWSGLVVGSGGWASGGQVGRCPWITVVRTPRGMYGA